MFKKVEVSNSPFHLPVCTAQCNNRRDPLESTEGWLRSVRTPRPEQHHPDPRQSTKRKRKPQNISCGVLLANTGTLENKNIWQLLAASQL